MTTPTNRNTSGQIRSKAERLSASATDGSAAALGEVPTVGSVARVPVGGVSCVVVVGFFVCRVGGYAALDVVAGFVAFVVGFSVFLAVVLLVVAPEGGAVTEKTPSTGRDMEAVLLNVKTP